ncbi:MULTISPECIES: JAB domain-containing protein [unclassified Myroides]|uniref:JAB domain-containing protein n=1 Tax=unclassified Myroides TaxID=2642485 RepID=UPI003D2F6665
MDHWTDPRPTVRQITAKRKEATQVVVAIALLDHLILTSQRYCSFADEGVL